MILCMTTSMRPTSSPASAGRSRMETVSTVHPSLLFVDWTGWIT